jgi:hypothetical protein
MQISVIPADKTIVMDGESLVFDFPFYPPNLRALQWNGMAGTMEFTSGPQQFIDNVAFVQPYIDAFNAEKARSA